MSRIRILLTDDHTLFRQGIHTLLSEESDIEVVGEAANGTEAVEQVGPLRPDVVLMDIGMPGLSSFEATRQIKKLRPETKILFLTMYDDEDYLVECMEVGRQRLRAQGQPGAAVVGGDSRCLSRRQLLEPQDAFATGRRFPLAHQDDASAAALQRLRR